MAEFTFSNAAYKKIAEKRKRKGIAEPLPRRQNIYTQWFINSLAILSANTLVAPLERVRIL